MNLITKLAPNQVFVFGSNSTGFSGAGSAGLACRGDASINWRTDKWFLKAMKSPVGSPDRIGKWAVYGVARGYQEGREGKSYAIETIKHPGRQWHKSVSIEEISNQILELVNFAKLHPELEFLMTPIGCGYAGYSSLEMHYMLEKIKVSITIPINLIIPPDIYINVSNYQT